MQLRSVAVWLLLVPQSVISPAHAVEPSSAQVTARDRIEKALSEPVTFSPFNGSLKQLRDVLQQKLKVPVYLDKRELKAIGTRLSTKIQFDLTGISGRSALEIMLGELELAWTIKDEVLWVTTLDKESDVVDLRVYPVTDLTRDGGLPDDAGGDFDIVIHLVYSFISPESWSEGTGPVQGITIGNRDLLVIPKTRRGHEEIAALFAMLRKDHTAKVPKLSARDAAAQRIEKALAKPASFLPFDGTLKQLRNDLQKKLKTPVYLDKRALSDVGVDPAAPVKFDVTGISGKAALRWMLGELDLAWIFKDEVLWITSYVRAQSDLEVRVYPVTDLVDKPAGAIADFDTIIKLVTSTVAPESWDEVGGTGAIQGVTIKGVDLLVVSQTHSHHKQLSATLGALRQCCESALPPPVHNAAEEKINKALAQPVTFTPFDGTLLQFREKLQKDLQIPVMLDRRALNDVGIKLEISFKSNLTGVSGKPALNQVLRELELTWFIRNEVLWITAIDFTICVLETRVYPVADLVRFKDKAGLAEVDYETLIELVTSVVSPVSWDEVGGVGSMQGITIKDCDLLVVSQTPDVLIEITELLTTLRKILATESKKQPAALSFHLHDTVAKWRIESALSKQWAFAPFDGTLQQFAKKLQQQLKVPVVLDERALNDVGMNRQSPLKYDFDGISGKWALHLALRQRDLTWIIEDEALWITTIDRAGGYLEARVYTVTDLVRPDNDEADESDVDFNSIAEFITSMVAPERWPSQSGPPPIPGFTFGDRDLIVVVQTPSIHEQIADFLAILRDDQARSQPAHSVQQMARRKIDRALSKPALFVPFKGTLDELSNRLQKQLKVPVRLDHAILADAGIEDAAKRTVQCDFAGITGKSALTLLLRDLKLAWTIKDETLLITTPEEADDNKISRFYRVGDLLPFKRTEEADKEDENNESFGFKVVAPGEGEPLDLLIDMVGAMVDPKDWDEAGGPANIAGFEDINGPLLVVYHTGTFHDRVADLLAKLRAKSKISVDGKASTPQ